MSAARAPRGAERRGLHLGWEGRAWVWIQRASAGMRVPQDFPRSVRAWASRDLDRPGSPYCSHLLGTGAAPLVGFAAATFDARLNGLARSTLRRWEASCRSREDADVLTGRGGALLAAAELETRAPGVLPKTLPRFLHESVLKDLSARLAGTKIPPPLLGLAHGIAGSLLALESSRAAFSLRVPDEIREKAVALLAQDRVVIGRVSAWPLRRGGPLMSAWCHGAPGVSLALGACWKASGRADYLKLARKGWLSTELLETKEGSFCCGSTGRAQVLVEAYRLTGEASFLEGARRIRREKSLKGVWARGETGLGRGTPGLRYLDDRLARPDDLPLPGLGRLSASGSSKPSARKARS